MNWIQQHLVGGGAFFTGSFILFTAALAAFFAKTVRSRQVARLLVVLGFLWVVASTTPIPVTLYVLWFLAVILGLIPWKYRKAGGILALVVCAVAVAVELPYHLTPRLPDRTFNELYVIGDSVSAGIGREKRTWPRILADDHKVNVINLARGGATARKRLASGKTSQIRFPPDPPGDWRQ